MARDTRHPADEPLARIAVRRIVARARGEAATPEFGRLLIIQALGAAGDAMIAVALAGSLFFSVPETTARSRVLLYLGLTVAPFAVVSPLLSRALDRHRASLRFALVLSIAGRAAFAWFLATRLESLLLFPLAFGVLVLSRAALVARGALLPALAPPERSLVGANSSLSKAAATGGMIAVGPAVALFHLAGEQAELIVASLVYAAGVLPAMRLPRGSGRRALDERMGARAAARSMALRQAVVAVAGMRLLVGFLVFHLAFALRREDLGSLGLGLLVASATAGSLAGALLAPRLRRNLREEGILVAALGIAGVAGIAAGSRFSVATAAALVLVFGVASGAAKLAFDSIVQRDIPEAARGWAFARFESVLQLAWVAGGLVPLAVTIPSGPGVIGAGVAASAFGLLFVVGRHRARRAALP